MTVELLEMNTGLVKLLGLRLDEVTPDRVVISWTITPEQHQPFGLLHGGVHCVVVETVASVGGHAWYTGRSPGGQVVGVSNQTDFFRAVSAGDLVAVGTPLHRGRLQQLWQAEIRDDQQRLVARGQVRLQNLEAREG
jgi:1,4-dihydroxy-2-naphthoyl-CoA hydrolase